MLASPAIINPAKWRRQKIGHTVVLVSNEADLKGMVHAANLDPGCRSKLLMSQLFCTGADLGKPAVAGPMIGAPYAVIILEQLIAQGARRFIFLGWCGAISPVPQIGELILPSGAFSGEGTSLHYGLSPNGQIPCSGELRRNAAALLTTQGRQFHEGWIWTTDALYRETQAKVARYQALQAVAVEMELSALLTVSRFRGVDFCSLLVVSDTLAGLSWTPGFHTPAFQQGCRAAQDAIADICRIG